MTERSRSQIFSTASGSRWQRFKWGSRFLLFVGAVGFALLCAAFWTVYNPALPQLKQQDDKYKMILHPDKHVLLEDTRVDRDYAGFRKYINAKGEDRKIQYVSKDVASSNFAAPIRAAFYDPSDEQSYLSLTNNIGHVNMLLPAYMNIDTTADTVLMNSDFRGDDIIKASGVKVVAMVSNYFGDDFYGASLHRIFHNAAKRARVISQIISLLQTNHFSGVNIDFEELTETSDAPMVAFMRELYARMHPLGLIVTQDVSPFNSDYNVKELVKYNDYLFLMAYDQFSESTGPGPVCSQKWIEAALDNLAQTIPTNKIVLGIAGYGYDWPQGGQGETVSYEEALSISEKYKAPIKFDDNTYNLSLKYFDEDSLPHTVYFTDAATNFNTLRFASEYGVAGVALWKMGSEDSRIWKFYDKGMSAGALAKFDFNSLRYVEASNTVDFIGEGEILEVESTPKAGYIATDLDSTELLISEENYERTPSVFVIKKFGKKAHRMVLSFDDGPDINYTPRILDILKSEHVPAIFFMIGINMENNIPLVKKVFDDGFLIGNHTFTHPNMAEITTGRAVLEMSATRLLLESITGHSTTLLRPPYNADAEPQTMQELIPVELGEKYNYLTVGESIDPNDWEPGVSADSIFARVVAQQDLGSVILLHDAGGNREATIKALPRIIAYFKAKGDTFTTVSDIINEKKEQLMPKVPDSRAYRFIQLNYYLAQGSFWTSLVLYRLFLTCIILSLLRILFFGILAVRQHYAEKERPRFVDISVLPRVCILIPAFNEEVNAVSTINNLLQLHYPAFEILFVDDGSIDHTLASVNAAFHGNERVTILTKPNGGKASALNYGIAMTDAEYVLCVDADTRLSPDALKFLIKHFENEATGAVAGNVRVGNEHNILTRWQSIEYITSQNFERNAYSNINAITVVPGAIGIFRKAAIVAVGGFTSDTLAEDCDLTIRLLRAGYKVENENNAVAYTEAPENLKMFFRQRFRWNFGVMQSFWKNRDALFNAKFGTLGWVALPNILIFQIMIPLLSPFVDLLMIFGLFTGHAGVIIISYLLFMLIDLGVAVLAFKFEREKISKLIWLVPQRIVYRWLTLYVLVKAIRRAIKGELQAWGVLKRTGNVREVH